MKEALTDLLLSLSRRFEILAREAVCCGDVTVAQCLALQHLLSGPCDVSALAENLGITLSAATRLLDGLSRRGWIERQRDPQDRRRVLSQLSPSGTHCAQNLRASTEAQIEQILRHIPSSEHTTVLRALQLVDTAVEASRQAWASCCAVSTGD